MARWPDCERLYNHAIPHWRLHLLSDSRLYKSASNSHSVPVNRVLHYVSDRQMGCSTLCRPNLSDTVPSACHFSP